MRWGGGTPNGFDSRCFASLGRSHRSVRAQGWRPPLVTLIQHAVAVHVLGTDTGVGPGGHGEVEEQTPPPQGGHRLAWEREHTQKALQPI